LVVGLDCADPRIVFGQLRGELSTLSQLMSAGGHGVLRSCVPPITVPAWTVMMSGHDPGELGVYGFRNRVRGSYREGRIAGTGAIRVPRLWDLMTKAGRPSVVVGVPPSYPVYPINGTWVGCFLTPGVTTGCCHPAALAGQLDGYMFDVSEYRTARADQLRRELWDMTRRRFDLLRRLARDEEWELFTFVEIGVDRVQHAFWKYYDPAHPQYPGPGNPYADVIPEYYRLVDAERGRLLAGLGDDVSIVVASDHGAQRMQGVFCVNQWLVEQGLLVLASEPSAPADLRPEDVDWPRTVAWGSGGYYARIYLNVAGREPHGIVPPDSRDAVVADIRGRLATLTDERGQPVTVSSYLPEDTYADVRGTPPDLMAFFGDLSLRASSKIGVPGLFLAENDTGPDGANHSFEGLYLCCGPGFAASGAGPERPIRSLFDVFRTVLDLPEVIR
jgi:predicted AlkP superfamily phosphohydrolase/phosphomutase